MIEIFYRNNFYIFILSRKKSKYKKVFKYFKQQNIMKRQWKDKYDHIFSGNTWSSYTYFYSIEITHTPIFLLCGRRYFLCCCEVDLVSSLFILCCVAKTVFMKLTIRSFRNLIFISKKTRRSAEKPRFHSQSLTLRAFIYLEVFSYFWSS